jgi:hypothetical protein
VATSSRTSSSTSMTVQAVLDGIPSNAALLDESGTIHYVNAPWYRSEAGFMTTARGCSMTRGRCGG